MSAIIEAIANAFLIVFVTMWVLGWLVILGIGALFWMLRRMRA